ncbi:MAG TPA: flagellar basal body-associated FliL family protein [Rhizomicrobium sp.]|jgi:flagellar FliL protein|nr:flagellar basal body-associated FliL family protein [Rhizomicrobium sp.]
MAKKEKAPESEEDGDNQGAEGEAAQAAPKKGLGKILALLKNKKVLVIAAPVLLLLIGGGGAGTYFLLLKKPADTKTAKAQDVPLTPPLVAFTDMQDILVNIQSNDGSPAYLKLAVSLELDDDKEKAAVQPLMPRVTDQFQAYLRELRVDDLKGSAGVLRIKEELLRRVNVAAAPYHVRDVLLKEMIVQ